MVQIPIERYNVSPGSIIIYSQLWTCEGHRPHKPSVIREHTVHERQFTSKEKIFRPLLPVRRIADNPSCRHPRHGQSPESSL